MKNKLITTTILLALFLQCRAEQNINYETLNQTIKKANALIKDGNLENALGIYKEIIAKAPHFYRVWHNFAHILMMQGNIEESIKSFETAISLNGESEVSKFQLAKAYLAAGEFKKGWEFFEHRYMNPNKGKQQKVDPTSLSGKRVLIRAEMGLGDMIQFIRYAKELKACGASIIVETPKPLYHLFSQCDYIDQLFVKGKNIFPFDVQISLLSLPYIFDTTVETIPQNIPYIYADETLIEFWRKKIISDKNFKVGICWKSQLTSGLEKNILTRRSLPLEAFLSLSEIENVSFYCLQKYNFEEINSIDKNFVIHRFEHFDEEHGGFMDTAALMKNLDLVITVDTSVAHLAGALGIPTFLILPCSSNWRWQLQEKSTPWYPNMRLFRKNTPDDHNLVIKEIKKALLHTKHSNKNNLRKKIEQANLFLNKGNIEESLELYKEIAAIASQSPRILYNLGYVCRIKGDVNDAINAYEKSLCLDPKQEDARLGLAKSYLSAGEFKKGWEQFEYRHLHTNLFKQKKIDPYSLKGKRVLLLSEWGLGDMMHFIRYAKLLKDIGATIIVEAFRPLFDLFSQYDYIDELFMHGTNPPPYDVKIGILSLPYIFDTTIDTIPAPIPYLYADKKLIALWKEKLKADRNFKVGLCWHSKPIHIEQQPRTRRSVPLHLFAPLSDIEGVSFYSLQQIHGTDQIKNLPEGFMVHEFGNDFDKTHGRFMDTAAVIKNLDLVISVDTSIVHLAGALGKPVWVLIPHSAEWRWMYGRNDTPWYPNITLFRQPQPNNWKQVIDKIKGKLEQII